MPRNRRIVGWIDRRGAIAEEEQTLTTHWSQMVGPRIWRCDHKAKETGWGTWRFEGAEGTCSWDGRVGINKGGDPDPALWIRDDYTTTYLIEKDYS